MCFLACFKATVSNTVFNHFHIESTKRLALLCHLVPVIYKTSITQFISGNKKLFLIKPLEVYGDLNKMFNGKTHSYKDVEKFVKDNTSKFKSDKTNGLLKLALKEYGLTKIQNVLKSYKRIRLEKLGNMLEMDKNILVGYFKTFTYVIFLIEFKFNLFYFILAKQIKC